MKLKTPPGEATAPRGHTARTVRLVYGDLSGWIAEGRRLLKARGGVVCPIMDYAEAHAAEGVDAVEAAILAHPDWGPEVACGYMPMARQVFNDTLCPHGDYIAAQGQRDLLAGLIEHGDWATARPAFEAMLAHKDTVFLLPETAELALDWLEANHPNPRAFLALPAVRGKFPAALDLSRFKAPDFDDKAA